MVVSSPLIFSNVSKFLTETIQIQSQVTSVSNHEWIFANIGGSHVVTLCILFGSFIKHHVTSLCRDIEMKKIPRNISPVCYMATTNVFCDEKF